MSASTRILEARARAGLSQVQLALRAGVPQPNLSADEAGRVQPRAETLARILAATVERPSLVLARERNRVLELAGHRGAGAVRVFGSIAQCTDAAGSDIDLLVTFAPDASILDAAGFVLDLEQLLGVHVDVMSDRAEGVIRDRADRTQQLAAKAIVIDLQTAVERLPEGYRDRHQDVAWAELRAMRSYLAHDYANTDYQIVWNALVINFPRLLVQLGIA